MPSKTVSSCSNTCNSNMTRNNTSLLPVWAPDNSAHPCRLLSRIPAAESLLNLPIVVWSYHSTVEGGTIPIPEASKISQSIQPQVSQLQGDSHIASGLLGVTTSRWIRYDRRIVDQIKSRDRIPN